MTKKISEKNMKIEPKEKFINWIVKIKILKEQINKLENLKDFPIISIAVFLLKCQIIEFELKQLIFSLDLHLYSQNNSKIIKRKIRFPKFLDDLTLGKLKKELDQFIYPFENPVLTATSRQKKSDQNHSLNELKLALALLVQRRNDFTHKMFSSDKDIQTLNKEAEEGLVSANKIIFLLEKFEKEIKEYEK